MAIFFNFNVSKISTNGDSIWLRVIQYGFEFMGSLHEVHIKTKYKIDTMTLYLLVSYSIKDTVKLWNFHLKFTLCFCSKKTRQKYQIKIWAKTSFTFISWILRLWQKHFYTSNIVHCLCPAPYNNPYRSTIKGRYVSCEATSLFTIGI